MLISWKYNFVFVHVPKTGGTALTRSLAPYARAKDNIAYIGAATPVARRLLANAFQGDHYKRITGFGVHAPVQELERALGREKLDSMTKAAFVRNPYSRAFSLYSHAKRSSENAMHDIAASLSFRDYALYLAEKKVEHQLLKLNYSKSTTVAMNFLGRFETFADDALRLGETLGLPHPLRPTVVNVNPDPQSDLRALFGDAREPFAEAFRLDFIRLGYSTDIDRAHEAPEAVD